MLQTARTPSCVTFDRSGVPITYESIRSYDGALMRTSAKDAAPTPPWKKRAHHVASETWQDDFGSASNWERLRAELDTFDEDISAPDDPYAGLE
mgnify:CR=1 FL=1